MGTLLSYFSNNRWSLQNLLDREENRPFEPRVNKEMTALDVWRAFSMAFIYLACAEFVLVHFLGKRASKRSKVSQLQVLSTNLLTSRDSPRFFDQVGHQTTNAYIGNIGFPNGPVFRYGNFFIPRVEEIFIPENHGPFRNCIPV